jgi:transcriptional regulator with XRE-family HTH domain
MPEQWTGREATALRQALRLTTDRFAARLGVSPRTVAHWAAHPATVPRMQIQEVLEDAYNRATPRVAARYGELLGVPAKPQEPEWVTPTEAKLIALALQEFSQRIARIEHALSEQARVPQAASGGRA